MESSRSNWWNSCLDHRCKLQKPVQMVSMTIDFPPYHPWFYDPGEIRLANGTGVLRYDKGESNPTVLHLDYTNFRGVSLCGMHRILILLQFFIMHADNRIWMACTQLSGMLLKAWMGSVMLTASPMSRQISVISLHSLLLWRKYISPTDHRSQFILRSFFQK